MREDASGALLADLLTGEGYDVERRIVPDDLSEIAGALRELSERVQLVLTTGGTGVAPRDNTPEATEQVLDRQIPGIAEALRADARSKTPHGLLGRGVAGIRGRALVVNFPGSPGGCRDGFQLLQPALQHALELVAGETSEHRAT